MTSASGAAVEFFDNKKQDKIWTVLSEFGDRGSRQLGRSPARCTTRSPSPTATQGQLDLLDRRTSTRPTTTTMFNGDGESFKNFYLDAVQRRVHRRG